MIFQKHIGSNCEEEYLSSTLDPSAKCLFSITNQSKKITSPGRKTPYKTPKTPSKTPFKIATGSKIPTVVPPLRPRNTPKSTARKKLPIIF